MDDTERPGRPGAVEAPRPRYREALTLALGLLALVGGMIWWAVTGSVGGGDRTASTVPAATKPAHPMMAQFIGDRSCRECHSRETAAHARSGHVQTLRPAGELSALVRWLDGRRVADPESPGVTWRYSQSGDKLSVERGERGTAKTIPLDYAFGSGLHAFTFVTVTGTKPSERVFLEDRLTYYSRTQSLDITPGQRAAEAGPTVTPEGSAETDAEGKKCFFCHVTLMSTSDPLELDLETMVPNVRCERCHGPGRAHVEEARKGREVRPMPLGPGRWTADEQMLFCGDCHRHPSLLQPGAIRTDDPEIARFQPVGLMQSACYRKSHGVLSCVTCHDPHARLSTDLATYEGACLSCHSGPSQTSCPDSPKTGCIGCHMPKRDTGPHLKFTDHWIQIRQAKVSEKLDKDIP